MSKLFRALGLESDAFVVPEGEVAFTESDSLISEGNGLAEANDEAIQTVATLESLNTILENSPEDQINETTAQIIDTVMGDITGRYEMVKESHLAIESFRARGAASYQRIAKEDISDKLAGFKKGLDTIIEKIIELIQKFWQWLTMNHKRVKAALVAATTAVKGAEGEQTIPFQVKFRTLLAEEQFTAESIDETANTLHDLCETSEKFITASFELGALTKKVYSHSTIEAEVKKNFKDYVTSNPGEYLFYSNIAGRKFALALNPDLSMKEQEGAQQVFETSISPIADRAESPENIVIGKDAATKMLQAAIAVVDISERKFKEISQIQNSLRKNKQLIGNSGNHTMTPKVMAAYNKCIVHFIDGAFTQALRHGNAVAALGMAYAKQGKNVIEA